MFARALILVLPWLLFCGCVKPTPEKFSSAGVATAKSSASSASPLTQIDAKGYCTLHCQKMSDQERIEYFMQFIWAPYVDTFQKHVDPATRAQTLTLQLNSSGKNWERAAREAAWFTKVSPGKWTMKIVVTPRETVKQLAELASKSYEGGTGPGEVIISGLLKAGEPRIEIARLQ